MLKSYLEYILLSRNDVCINEHTSCLNIHQQNFQLLLLLLLVHNHYMIHQPFSLTNLIQIISNGQFLVFLYMELLLLWKQMNLYLHKEQRSYMCCKVFQIVFFLPHQLLQCQISSFPKVESLKPYTNVLHQLHTFQLPQMGLLHCPNVLTFCFRSYPKPIHLIQHS